MVIECGDPATCQAVAEQMSTTITWLVNATIVGAMGFWAIRVGQAWWDGD